MENNFETSENKKYFDTRFMKASTSEATKGS